MLVRRHFHASAVPMINAKPRVLLTGALGQLGVGMTRLMQQRFGVENVFPSDIRKPSLKIESQTGSNFRYIDVTKQDQMHKCVVEDRIDWIVHLSALLSFVGEQRPDEAMRVNLTGFQNALDVARVHKLRIFSPSTIGVFGPTANAAQREGVTEHLAPTHPQTMYGITKVFSEHLGQYYHDRYDVDFRSCRYPGVLSADTEPGGGTTDYAVDVFHHVFNTVVAASGSDSVECTYYCPLPSNSRLPMMHIDDCLQGTLDFIQCDESLLRTAYPADQVNLRTYHVSGLSFTPMELGDAISKFLAHNCIGKQSVQYDVNFKMLYDRTDPVRTRIAASWPDFLDDSLARKVWQYNPTVLTLDEMVRVMMHQVANYRKMTIEVK